MNKIINPRLTGVSIVPTESSFFLSLSLSLSLSLALYRSFSNNHGTDDPNPVVFRSWKFALSSQLPRDEGLHKVSLPRSNAITRRASRMGGDTRSVTKLRWNLGSETCRKAGVKETRFGNLARGSIRIWSIESTESIGSLESVKMRKYGVESLNFRFYRIWSSFIVNLYGEEYIGLISTTATNLELNHFSYNWTSLSSTKNVKYQISGGLV